MSGTTSIKHATRRGTTGPEHRESNMPTPERAP